MEKGRIKRRKRRRWLGYMAFLAVVLTVAAVLCLAMFFRTQEIVVVGNQRYTAEEIISASGIQLEQNVFTVDRARTAEQIKGVFSYLEEVEVVPVLPTTMEIRLVEMCIRDRTRTTKSAHPKPFSPSGKTPRLLWWRWE